MSRAVPPTSRTPATASAPRHREPLFVGREVELEALARVVEGEDAPAVTWISGLAGVGKSALLRAFAERVGAAAVVVAVDGETTEPTEAGFLRVLSAGLGRHLDGLSGLDAALEARTEPVVITVDAAERLRLLDDWLRRALVPALGPRGRLVVAGRDAPVAAWTSLHGGRLQRFELDTLRPADAVELLRRLDVPAQRAAEINRAVRGHPLALRLTASVAPATAAWDAALVPAVDELARLYLAGLDTRTRRALDAAGVVRRVTVPLLEALAPDLAADDAFARLRELPFVTLTRDGLMVHHVVREVVATELRAADPARYRRLRATAWRHLRAELDEVAETDLWRSTADMLYLVEHPAIRDAFFPPAAPGHAVEPAGAHDWREIEAIGTRHEPPAGAQALRAWWDGAPGAFFVARDADGSVAGFSAVAERGDVPRPVIDGDPVAQAWQGDLRRDPVARGERVLLIRFMLSRASGERPAPAQSALYLDLKRLYLAMRPALRRLYTCAHEIADMDPVLRPLGFEPLAAEPQLDGVAYRTYRNEFGPSSVEGWLAGLAARAVLGARSGPLDEERRQLVVDGTRTDLTRREFDVLRCLHERAGTVVPRAALVREVWGRRWTQDGNALESVVSALRRKLGARAAALETVRGVGYRLRPLD